MDIQQAYRMVPVHPDDRALLGMRWEGGVYIDTRLPFGLRSAPIIFTAVADALEWCIWAHAGSEVHMPLPGRLRHSGQSRLNGVCSESCSHPWHLHSAGSSHSIRQE